MSISNFCVSESSNSKFLEDLEKETKIHAKDLQIRLNGLIEEELNEEKRSLLFKLEKHRIEQIEAFFQDNRSQSNVLENQEDISGSDKDEVDKNQKQTNDEEECTIQFSKFNPKGKKRGSLFATSLNSCIQNKFKRYSAVQDKIGDTLSKMGLQKWYQGQQDTNYLNLEEFKDEKNEEENSEANSLKKEDLESDDSHEESTFPEIQRSVQFAMIKVIPLNNHKLEFSENKLINLVNLAKPNNGEEINKSCQNKNEMNGFFLIDSTGLSDFEPSPKNHIPLQTDCNISEPVKIQLSLNSIVEKNINSLFFNSTAKEIMRVTADSLETAYDVSFQQNKVQVKATSSKIREKSWCLPNEIQLTLDSKNQNQFKLQIQRGFFGAFVNFPVESFNQKIRLEKGFVCLLDFKRGFLVSHVISKFEDKSRELIKLIEHENTILVCGNLSPKNNVQLGNYLRKQSEIPSCASSCSSSFSVSSQKLRKNFLRTILMERNVNGVVLTKIKYLDRHRTFKSEKSYFVFEIEIENQEIKCLFGNLEGSFKFGKTENKKYESSGLTKVCPFYSLNLEFDFEIEFVDKKDVFLRYLNTEKKDNLICDFLDVKNGEINFQKCNERKSKMISRNINGFWCQLVKFIDGEDFFEGEFAIPISFGCIFRVANFVFKVEKKWFQNAENLVKII